MVNIRNCPTNFWQSMVGPFLRILLMNWAMVLSWRVVMIMEKGGYLVCSNFIRCTTFQGLIPCCWPTMVIIFLIFVDLAKIVWRRRLLVSTLRFYTMLNFIKYVFSTNVLDFNNWIWKWFSEYSWLFWNWSEAFSSSGIWFWRGKNLFSVKFQMLSMNIRFSVWRFFKFADYSSEVSWCFRRFCWLSVSGHTSWA